MISMEKATLEAQIATMRVELKHLEAAVEALKVENIRRDERRSAQHRETMEALEAIRLEVHDHKGFFRGAKWAVGIVWLLFGGAAATFVSQLLNK